MMRKLGSADALLDLCLCAYVIRMLLYAILPIMKSPWFGEWVPVTDVSKDEHNTPL